MDREYDNWIKIIARKRNLKALIKHFREHVGEHFDRFDRSIPLNLDTWLLDVINFANIFKEKNLNITKQDLLFKLALHHRKHNDGLKPNFDTIDFIKNYQGRFKKFDKLSLEDPRDGKEIK